MINNDKIKQREKKATEWRQSKEGKELRETHF